MVSFLIKREEKAYKLVTVAVETRSQRPSNRQRESESANARVQERKASDRKTLVKEKYVDL